MSNNSIRLASNVITFLDLTFAFYDYSIASVDQCRFLARITISTSFAYNYDKYSVYSNLYTV
jgi:hypothetical protein